MRSKLEKDMYYPARRFGTFKDASAALAFTKSNRMGIFRADAINPNSEAPQWFAVTESHAIVLLRLREDTQLDGWLVDTTRSFAQAGGTGGADEAAPRIRVPNPEIGGASSFQYLGEMADPIGDGLLDP
jgi:hypothetical protein